MAIRMRMIAGEAVALCAAKSIPQPGDIYINDLWHYALAMKFAVDDETMSQEGMDEEPVVRLMLEEEEKYDVALRKLLASAEVKLIPLSCVQEKYSV